MTDVLSAMLGGGECRLEIWFPLVWILGSLYLSGGILRVCGARRVEGGSPAQRSDALRRFVLGII